VPPGESVGIIGRNGAGKSTLLKLLASITAPTRGRIAVHGRLAALIEVGSGFHPELTGRENVFLSGTILGMRRREISQKLDRIVQFAGVERFIDTPVKWYSSGMYVRLGFSVAAHLEPDILLVDEVLAVGDAEFQVKCLQRIDDLRRSGMTIVFISHDLAAVERLCDTAMLIDKGVVAAYGRPDEIVAAYNRQLLLDDAGQDEAVCDPANTDVTITSLTLRDVRSAHAASFQTGGPLTVSLRYRAARALDDLECELIYYVYDGKVRIATFRTSDRGQLFDVRPPGGTIEFTCPALPLRPGTYLVGAVVRSRAVNKALSRWEADTVLYVESGRELGGQVYLPHTWQVTHAEADDRVAVPIRFN
jgi:lipopolysaccharide transport system ATP-binding protein